MSGEHVYLDTDIVLTIIGRNTVGKELLLSDELEIKDSKTSVFTILEILDMMEEMGEKIDYERLISEIEEKGIELLSFTPEVLTTAIELRSRYKDLSVLRFEHFIHSAHSILAEEPLVSPDPAYREIEEVELIDLTLSKDEEDYDFMSKEMSAAYLDIF